MKYINWIKIFLASIIFTISIFAIFNYYIDPLWNFCHSNKYNNAQPGFDERQLKTNRAYFCGLKQYDTLLIGSSRVTYINQHDFPTKKVFNYACEAMYPSELEGWINVAKKIRGGHLKLLLLV